MRTPKRVFQDEIFTEKAGQKWKTGDRQTANGKRPIGGGHPTFKPAHFTDVLLFAHAVDDTAGAEKKEGFEERMGHHMKHPRRIRADPKPKKHIAQLTDR